MADNDRIRRPPLTRRSPIRTTRQILRDLSEGALRRDLSESALRRDLTEGARQQAGPEEEARMVNNAGHTDEVIGRAVKMAYRVVDDHIRQGRQAAERVRAGTYSSVDFESDLKTVVDRMIGLSKELGAVSLELFDTLIRGQSAPKTAAPSATDCAIEQKSARRVQVSVDFRPTTAGFLPTVPPLYASDRSLPPLEKVHFVVKDGTRPVLVVEVPDDQPLGTYTGAIVDEKTHEAGGFVTVRVVE